MTYNPYLEFFCICGDCISRSVTQLWKCKIIFFLLTVLTSMRATTEWSWSLVNVSSLKFTINMFIWRTRGKRKNSCRKRQNKLNDKNLFLSPIWFRWSLLQHTLWLPACTIKPLQTVQKAAAHLVLNQPTKKNSWCQLFITLHWLRAAARIKFKSQMSAYSVATSTTATYLNSLIQVYERPHSFSQKKKCNLLCTLVSLLSGGTYSPKPIVVAIL